MKVMIAGGAGFIGSHLEPGPDRAGTPGRLCRRPFDRPHGQHRGPGPRPSLRVHQGRRGPHPGRIRRRRHRAPCVTGEPRRLRPHAHPHDARQLPGHVRLLDVADTVGARLLFVSTSEVYGDPLVDPQPETDWGNVDPVGPRSCYDELQRFGEALLFAARRERGTQANIVRLFNTYGPSMRRDDGRVIPEMVSAALAGRPLTVHGNGSQTRSFGLRLGPGRRAHPRPQRR